jgi:putative ABC transport system permease protein
MSLFMIFRIAFKALGRNKLRTGLTMLGMIIGVAAVITMVALGSGAQAAIEDQIRGAGTNMITVFPGAVMTGGVKLGEGSSNRLTADNAKALRALPEVEYVSEGVQTRQQIIVANQNWSSTVVGVNVDYVNIKSWPMKYGTFFTEQDVTSAAKVCTVGVNVAENLFGADVDPTGTEIRIRNQVFKVLGVMAPKGASSSGQNQDDQVFTPFTTVLKKLQNQEFLTYILAGARSASEIRSAAAAVTTEMRFQHKIGPGDDDDFRVQTQEDMIAVRTQATQTMTSLLAGIAAVSLLVGGIGIMNIMLVSVTERTREIGLRMAIGARGFDVLLQFLLEAVLISLVGGAIGIGLGFGASDFVKWYQQWPTVIEPNAIVTSFGFAGAIGVFFGFYPARKAASLDPIEALRFE